MIDSDLAKFSEILDSLSEYYQRDPLSPMAVKIYFRALIEFPIESIGDAVSAHIQHPETGKFYPKAADLIKHLEGGTVTADQVVAAAKLADTPLGILARIHIGTCDLDSTDRFYVRQRAEEVLQLLSVWKARATKGEYTDHEISIMIKYGVDPRQPFYTGLAAPQDQTGLLAHINHVTGTRRHQELIEPPYRDQATAQTSNPVPLAKTLERLESDNG
jgi:hypothetical protein